MDHIIKLELNEQKIDFSLNSFDNIEKINSEIKDAYNLIVNRFNNELDNMKKNRNNELDYIDFYFIELLNEQFNNYHKKNK